MLQLSMISPSSVLCAEVEHVVVAGAGKEDGKAAQQDSTPQAEDAALAFSQAGVASASAAGSAALQPPGMHQHIYSAAAVCPWPGIEALAQVPAGLAGACVCEG